MVGLPCSHGPSGDTGVTRASTPGGSCDCRSPMTTAIATSTAAVAAATVIVVRTSRGTGRSGTSAAAANKTAPTMRPSNADHVEKTDVSWPTIAGMAPKKRLAIANVASARHAEQVVQGGAALQASNQQVGA